MKTRLLEINLMSEIKRKTDGEDGTLSVGNELLRPISFTMAGTFYQIVIT